MGKKSMTRAVIIGISDYQDDNIPDLQFAHRDAQAFANYLQSPSGGNLSSDNIKLYLNEEATGGNVHKALYWLISESNENDNCIIYFSGHGDVETIYEDEPGHLLIHDSPSSIYQINSLRVDDLNRIIKTLSVKKKAKVKLFTDACRAGKLAGSEINGAQATAAALNKQFGNEIKILSCQANEYSIEGPQWGDGRGVFSYHLIEGMTGLADSDKDLVISLKEIQRYIEDKVQESTNGTKQTPIAIGDRNTTIALVNKASLDALIQDKNLDGLIASVDAESTNLPKGNSNEELISLFYAALESNNLLVAYDKDNINSAEYYYNKIIELDELINHLPVLKGDYIAHLQDDAQQAINLYLSVDHEEMKKRWYGEEVDFKKYSDYLHKASELIGETHYLYAQIKSKQIYFEVLSERIANKGKKIGDGFYPMLQEKLKEALTFQTRAPFLHNELGLLYDRNKEYNKAIEQFDIAIDQSPTWALPYNNKSYVYNKLKKYDKAIEIGYKAIDIDSKFVSPYHNIAKAYLKKKEYTKSIEYDLKYLELFPENYKILNNAGYGYYLLKDYKKAITYFDKAITLKKDYITPYYNKSDAFLELKEYNSSIETLMLAKENGANYSDVHTNVGICYERQSDDTSAIKHYKLAADNDKQHISRIYLAWAYLNNAEINKSIKEFQYYIEKIEPQDNDAFFGLASAYAQLGDLSAFEENMQAAIEMGFLNKKKMEESIHLSSIKDTEVYLNFLNKL